MSSPPGGTGMPPRVPPSFQPQAGRGAPPRPSQQQPGNRPQPPPGPPNQQKMMAGYRQQPQIPMYYPGGMPQTMQQMPPRMSSGMEDQQRQQSGYMAMPGQTGMRFFPPGQYAHVSGGGAGRGGAPQQFGGYAARPMGQGSSGGHMYGQPVQMYTNPVTQGTKQQQQPQGGPRPMTGIRSAPPGQGAPGYMGGAQAAPPAKPKSRAILIVDPTSGEALNVEPLKPVAPAEAPAAPPSSAAILTPAPAQPPPPSGPPPPSKAPADAETKSPAAAAPPSPAESLASLAPAESVSIALPAVAPATAPAPALAPAPAPAPAEPSHKAAVKVTAAPEPSKAPAPAAATKAAESVTPSPAATGAGAKPAEPAAPERPPELAPASAESPAETKADESPADEDDSKKDGDDDDDWESKDESQLLIEPPKPKPAAPVMSLRPGGAGGMSFASSTKVSAAASSGKKVYEKEFLLEFARICTERPDTLPEMEIIMSGPGGDDRPAGGKGGKGGGAGGGPDEWRRVGGRGAGAAAAAPGKGGGPVSSAGADRFGNADPRGRDSQFGKGGPQERGRRDGGGKGRGGGGGGGGRGGGGFIEVKPLTVSDNRWKPTDAGKVDELEKLLRTTKGLLNKFTPEKMAKLTEQFLDLEINSRTDMVAVIDLVFDKALFEPIFGYMYSELCARCAEKFPEFKDELNPDAKPHTFKRLLLNKCQEEFEKENFVESVLAELPEDATPEERELIRKRTKSRMLGNIRFIGELYKQKMLTEKIMHECLMKLLGEVENPDEDEIECLCKLLTTIGKMIDHAKAKPHIDEYFLRMNEMAKNAALPNRMRFMLQECIDLRRGNWSVRKADPKAKSESDAERAGKGKGGIQAGNGDIRGRGAAAGRGAPGGRGAGGKIEKPKSNESGPSVAAAPPPPPKFTAEELTDKIEQTLEEYFSGAGLDELVQCARDLQPRVAEADSLSKQMVQTAMSKGFDARTDDQREKVGRIFGGLSKSKILSPAVLKNVFDETLEFIEDDVVDIPKVDTYMAQYIAQAVCDGAIKLSFINEGFAHLVEAERLTASHMSCEVLRSLRVALSDDAKLRQMYVAECDLLKCLPAESTRADLAKLLDREKLAFIDPQLSVDVAKAREEEELVALQGYLKGALGEVTDLDGGESDDTIVTWVQENTSCSVQVARHLFRSLLETAPIPEGDAPELVKNLAKQVLRRKELLKKHTCCTETAEQNKRQSNCLFEVQRYCCNANWPQGLAKKLFYQLYDQDIVFEEAYNVWREDSDDTTDGKPKALFQVNEFLQWLETADAGEEEEEDES